VSDKADRATVEQALDPRTRMVLFKMISRGFLTEVNGCVSTGKEANVYHASTPSGDSMAIKVFKTSILVFKDRDRWVRLLCLVTVARAGSADISPCIYSLIRSVRRTSPA
jgi:serine/threonine-protein kinase RIO1